MTAARKIPAVPVLTLLLLAAMLFLSGNAAGVTAMLADRILLCLQTLIPSLFGCMVLSNLLQMSGGGAWLGKRLHVLSKRLHLSADVTGIFIVSQVAGYPVGTLLLRRAASQGKISTEDAARFSGVCFGGGPAFLVGLAGVQLFGSAPSGWVMLSACMVSNLVLARIIRPKAPPVPDREERQSHTLITAAYLTDAVASAVAGLMQICGMVLFFGLLLFLAEQLHLDALPVLLGSRFGVSAQTARAVLTAAADVTQLPALFRCGLPFHVLLPLTAGLLSFGGLCVHCQCLAASGGTLPLRHLIAVRLAAACLTALLTAICVPLIPFSETVAAFSANAALSESRSVIPGLLIFFTGFPFLLKKD